MMVISRTRRHKHIQNTETTTICKSGPMSFRLVLPFRKSHLRFTRVRFAFAKLSIHSCELLNDCFFSYLSGYIVKADLTLFSEKPYVGLGSYYSYDSYSYKTVCHATFTAGDDEYVASAEERYQYYAAGGLITCAAAVAAFIGAKRRRLFTCLEAEEDGEGRTTMSFREMEKEKPDP